MIYAIHPVGKLTVTPEGAYLRFHAEAPQAAGLLRLWLSGCGRCESLGLMEPRGGRLVLDRRLSRCRPMMHPMLYGAVTPERSLSQR